LVVLLRRQVFQSPRLLSPGESADVMPLALWLAGVLMFCLTLYALGAGRTWAAACGHAGPGPFRASATPSPTPSVAWGPSTSGSSLVVVLLFVAFLCGPGRTLHYSP
jgi:hypothetical protein